MARPTKCRRVCKTPQSLVFSPESPSAQRQIILTVDEYEAIRLIDRSGLSQEECSAQMGVSRTTVQKIYDTARKKLAEAVVDGLTLRIEGGEYVLCDGQNGQCKQGRCFKQKIKKEYYIFKGDNIMRIAVTYQDGMIFQHFGHTEQFKIYDVEGGKILSSKIVDTDGQGHGALADVLNGLSVDALICGGIGGGAQMALSALGIKLYGGVSGSADEAVAACIAGKLDYDPDVRCSHHDHEHGDGEHTCGEHGCGGGRCGNH